MSHFNSTAPAWNDIPPLDVCSIAVPTQTGAVSVATTAGQFVISMHNFGVRLRFGECQFGDYGMLIKEPPAVIPVVTNGENLTIIEGGGHTLTLHHQPLSFEVLKILSIYSSHRLTATLLVNFVSLQLPGSIRAGSLA